MRVSRRMCWTTHRAACACAVLVTNGLAAAKCRCGAGSSREGRFRRYRGVRRHGACARCRERAGASRPDTANGSSVVAGMKKVVLRTGMEALYFTGAHRVLRPVARRRRRDPDPASCAPAATGRVPAEPACSKSRPAFLEDVIARLRRSRRRHRLARRDAPPPDRAATSAAASSASPSTTAIATICAMRCRS